MVSSLASVGGFLFGWVQLKRERTAREAATQAEQRARHAYAVAMLTALWIWLNQLMDCLQTHDWQSAERIAQVVAQQIAMIDPLYLGESHLNIEERMKLVARRCHSLRTGESDPAESQRVLNDVVVITSRVAGVQGELIKMLSRGGN